MVTEVEREGRESRREGEGQRGEGERGRGGEQRYTKKLFTGPLNRLFIGGSVLKSGHAVKLVDSGACLSTRRSFSSAIFPRALLVQVAQPLEDRHLPPLGAQALARFS